MTERSLPQRNKKIKVYKKSQLQSKPNRQVRDYTTV